MMSFPFLFPILPQIYPSPGMSEARQTPEAKRPNSAPDPLPDLRLPAAFPPVSSASDLSWPPSWGRQPSSDYSSLLTGPSISTRAAFLPLLCGSHSPPAFHSFQNPPGLISLLAQIYQAFLSILISPLSPRPLHFSYEPPWGPSYVAATVLPQGLCTCYARCPDCSAPLSP